MSSSTLIHKLKEAIDAGRAFQIKTTLSIAAPGWWVRPEQDPFVEGDALIFSEPQPAHARVGDPPIPVGEYVMPLESIAWIMVGELG